MESWTPLTLGLDVIGVLVLVVHVSFAHGVARESRRSTTDVHTRCLLVPRSIRILTTLLGGPWVGAMCWLLHGSALNRRLTGP